MSHDLPEDLEDLIKADEKPAPGGPNDPGASSSDQNQADTPGYSGGGDDDPTMGDPPLRSPDDPAILDDINAPEDPDLDGGEAAEEP